MRRFGLIGDVHAEDGFLAAALERLVDEGASRILCTGDIVDGRGSVDRCADLLQARHVDTVRGNHDRWLLDRPQRSQELFDLAPSTRSFLGHLPKTRRYATTVGSALLCHAFGEDDMVFVDDVLACAEDEKTLRQGRGKLLRLVPRDISIAIVGHTHRRGVRRLGHLVVINAGTLRGGDTPCFSIVDLGARTVEFFYIDEDGTVPYSETIALPRIASRATPEAEARV